MSERTRPWWASDETVEGLAPDEDPVERARAARHGAATEADAGEAPAGTAPGEPWLRAAMDSVSRFADDLARTAEATDEGTERGRGPDRASEAAAGDGGGPAADHDGGARARTGGQGAAADGEHAHGGASGRPRGEPTAAGEQHLDVCGICPVCVGLRALAEARPELVGHLAEAARHVALAARSLRERPDAPDASGARRADDEPLERIDLD